MSSLQNRDQGKDHLLTPKNAAFVISDYQPAQIRSIFKIETIQGELSLVSASVLFHAKPQRN